jgi:hypothetical protein
MIPRFWACFYCKSRNFPQNNIDGQEQQEQIFFSAKKTLFPSVLFYTLIYDNFTIFATSIQTVAKASDENED